jgi:hypothetical protein
VSPRSDLPAAAFPHAPDAGRLWSAALVLLWICLGAFLLDRLSLLLMNAWLLESLGLSSVFWTNFRMGAKLYAVGFGAAALAIVPAVATEVGPLARRIVVHVGLMAGLVFGYFFSLQYLSFLFASGAPFDSVDPVFGNDASFYVAMLNPAWALWWLAFLAASLSLASWLLCSYLGRSETAAVPLMTRVERLVGQMATVGTRLALIVWGLVVAAGWRLARYDVLTKDNSDSSIFTGAAYVDVTGVFSTVNDYHVTAAVTLGVTAALTLALGILHQAARGEGTAQWRRRLVPLGVAMVSLLVLDLAFKASVSLRQLVFVGPNEPVIQLPYIRQHIEATRSAFEFDEIETVRFVPKGPGDPLPDVEELVRHPSIRNAPLWPGFVSYLEDLIDLQHAQRILQTNGDPMIYGPLLEIFRQQQKLRAYYNFLDVDTIRYRVDGEPQVLVSAVREVPLVEPQPWLAWWGQQFMLYTHGSGLVSASVKETTPEGEPVYVSSGIPVASRIDALAPRNQAVYYGEGSGSMAYSNVRDMKELDYPTDEGRAEIEFAADVAAGVPMDSLLKRIVFGYKSGQFFDVVFSTLITERTRVHYFRTPLERLERIAPFLYYDTDPFAVADGERIVWMVNGLTHTDLYPFSQLQELGDKSDERTPFPRPHVMVNYVRDAVKATVDAYTGAVKLYKFSNEPIVRTWAEIYPDLFTLADEMPPALREQVQYPVQLMHVQFDDAYIYYQMRDPMTFFNMEDMWDDADEVLGPMLDAGKAIRFSMEPYYMVVDTGEEGLPAATPERQFAMAMVFTPENALNLRAIPVVYQDGEDYGRVVSLQVPKGHFFPGPEQADSAIDQEPEIAQRLTWWNRRGLEVIRGHTTALLVDGEVIYVEPIFLRSQQNPVTQLKRVAVVFRGVARMGATLEDALRLAVAAHREGAPLLAAGTATATWRSRKRTARSSDARTRGTPAIATAATPAA